MVICEYCGKSFNPSEGAWDDGDYMCGECIAGYIERSETQRNQERPSSGQRSKPGKHSSNKPKKA